MGCARRRETIRYDDLAQLIGFDAPGNRLAEPLGRVMRYCEKKGLPPLTVIVVNQYGKPGPGLMTSTDFDQDRENVYAHPWLSEAPLATDDLTTPWRPAP